MCGRLCFIGSAVSLLCPFLCGCYLTGTMWKEAGATRMNSPEIVGVIRPGTGDAPGGGIVVRYELDTEWRARQYPFVFLKVPLHGTSPADSPFCVSAGAHPVRNSRECRGWR